MGLMNKMHDVETAINQQTIEIKKTQEHQKRVEYMKSELRSMLQNELMDLNDIFGDETKATAIENVLNNTTILLYDRKYTRQFLNDKYYTVARQVEQIKKKTAPENQDNYKKQIALEKWELQKKREELRIKQLEQKIKQNEQKYNMKQAKKQLNINWSGCITKTIKVLLYLTLAPIAICGIVLYGFISAIAKSK